MKKLGKQNTFDNTSNLDCGTIPETDEIFEQDFDEEIKQGFTLEEAYQKVGGFGIFHWIMCACIMNTFIFSMIVGNELPFLELVPHFRC